MDSAMGDDDGSSVRVAVRVRPLIGREKVERCDECVSVVEDEMQIVMGKNRSFTYDYVYSKYAQQSDIWSCVGPLVNAAFDGYNATIFAYGQTGSGKTFTMGSGSSVNVPPEEYGIVPRVIEYIFNQVNVKTLAMPQYRAEVRIRFLEIYGEEIHDLLVYLGSESTTNASGDSKVTLRETDKGEVLVTGAIEELVDDADQCLRLLERGTLSRTTGSTLMNAHSSRSHAIFTVSLVQHIPLEGAGEGDLNDDDFETRTSFFNFVDLAGSERQKRTQAEGKRLKEGIDINKGLLALGNVISALGDDSKRGRVHVPYRDSKLTRMLQDSLGGNSRTLMLCCVSPADVNFEETLNALKYANRARNIKNKPVVNRDEASAMTAELRRQVQMLQAEVFRLRNPGMSESELKLATPMGLNMIGMSMDADTYTSLRSRAETAENEVGRLTSELKRNRTQLDCLREEMIAAQAERDFLRLCVEETGPGSELTAPGERAKTSNVLTEQLRTIATLQEKVREVERERDHAMMNPMMSGSSSMAFGMSSSMTLPAFSEPEIKIDTDLLERAEKEIEREAEMLKKLQGDASMEEENDASDSATGEGDGGEGGEGDDEEMGEESAGGLALNLELTEEDADRARVFQRRQRHLGESVQGLAHEISVKEELLQTVRQAKENYDRLKILYETQMAHMAEKVRNIQLDRDRLIEEIQQVESKIRSSGDQSSAVGNGRLTKLSNDLKEKNGELMVLKKKQNEMDKFMSQKKKNDMQLRVLTSEIGGMKRQKVELVKKMQEERKRFEEEANRRHREILSLKKSQQRDKQKIQQLGSQKEAQERVLKRKMEEINATKARLKQQQTLQAQARRTQTTNGRNRMGRGNEAKWLSDEVKRRAEEQRKLEQLQKEREMVMKEMEKLYAHRDKLESDLRTSINAKSSIRDVLISPMKARPLVRRHSGAAGSPERQLTQEEEQLLFDLEERIEACQAQLEYKEDKISEIAEDGGALVKIDSTQSLPEARTLLKMLFGMAVDVKKQDQLKEQEVAKMQVEVSEISKRLEQERDRTQLLKQNYEEALQKVMASGEPTSAPASVGTPLNERTRILLSVSEERNAALRQKCDELESVRDHIDRERQLLHQKLAQEQQEVHASRDHIRWLEQQLAGRGDPSASNQGREVSAAPHSHSPSSPSASYAQPASGPVSWANEFEDDEEDDDDDDDMGEEDSHQEEDYDMESSAAHPGGYRGRRDFRVQLDDMGDNLDSISINERARRGFATQRSDESREAFHDHHSGGDVKDDSPTLRNDDAGGTGTSSIFSRLSNPNNFTGIHKNRARESVSKREVLQHRSEKVRSRRLKDRGGSIAKPPRATTPTEQRMLSVSKFAVKPQAKRSSVMEVLESMKMQKDTTTESSHHRPRSPVPRSSSSLSDSNDNAGGTGFASMIPPPTPYSDVYSRLAAQYTQSAQSKRQRSAPPSRRTAKTDDGSNNDGALSSNDVHSQDEANGLDESDYMSEDYDPLLGTSGSNLVSRVHDDYRERLSGRSSSMPKLAAPSSSAGSGSSTSRF